MNGDRSKKMMKLDEELKKEGLTRRDALKLLGVGAGAMAVGGSVAFKATSAYSSDKNVKVLIIGGGLSGIATAAKLRSMLSKAEITVVEPNKQSVSYQPGNTFIGAGLYEKKDVIYNTDEYLPDDITFIHDRAVAFDPESNKVTLKSGKELSYDYMVVAAGLVFDFAKIQGLEELGDIYTLDDGQKMVEFFGNSGASTIYNTDAAVLTWQNMQKIGAQAYDGKRVEAVFTHPNTAIKCGGAPKKIMYLMDARLREMGGNARCNVNMTFYPNGSKMFAVPEYNDAILRQFKEKNFRWNYAHNLTAVDLKNKTATFNHHWEEKGAYDEDLEEYDMISKSADVTVPFDFLHISPPAKAPDEIGKSPIGSGKGWVPVHKETLQHVKYENIFSLGDIAAVPLGKTGGTARKQYKVLCDNLVAHLEGKEMTAKFDGYTVCPIITDIGKVMLAEFDWTLKPTPSFPLDPTQERYIWWVLKTQILKPMTQHGMLSGLV